MKIEIEIPDPKFNAGDAVKLDNLFNDKQIYLRVDDYSFDGTWKHTKAGTEMKRSLAPGVWSDGRVEYTACYYCVFLPDSWTDSIDPAPLSGEIIFSLAVLEERGEKVEL